MKISRIEFENFRNFKEHGVIDCSTDGKVTIIYGKNGDGKTTLHQLLQWVFYGHVHFNKTTTEILYNLQFESECAFNDIFSVMGCIDFEHDGVKYSLRRTRTYQKQLQESVRIEEDITLSKMDDDYNWLRVDRPKETIEKLLPSGLSDYFFFDGESMIADLRVKGRESANKLRKALYSMFDLDVVESAITHIGKTNLKTTALGKLYLSKGTMASGSLVSQYKTNIESAQTQIALLQEKIKKGQERKKELSNIIQQVSEQIGGTKSKAEYENQRKKFISQRDRFLNAARDCQTHFGDDVIEMFPKLFISKSVNDAKKKIHLKIEESRLPVGVTKKLVNYLLDKNTGTCVCGNVLSEKEKEHIKQYLTMLPPKSYASLYQEFSKTAAMWGKGYDKERLEAYIQNVLEFEQTAYDIDKDIMNLDEEAKKSADVEELIIARQKAEVERYEIDAEESNLTGKLNTYELVLGQQMKKFNEATQNNEISKKVNGKIAIMEKVSNYFTDYLQNESKEKSEQLQLNMQELIDKMLTSKRTVSVSNEFSVRVVDSHNNESKSEGQFAVVSFAYIGGILKMLQSQKGLQDKEYPLVLDGPFSKLDPDQRLNVVNEITNFAPQVILFSKDDLHGIFPDDRIGRVWTITSNAEKNVAKVEEGHLWK